MKSFSLALSLTILLGLCGVTFASTWYVDSSVSSGTGTIDDPFPNFYDAVVSAASGDIIYARVPPFFSIPFSFFFFFFNFKFMDLGGNLLWDHEYWF